MPETETITIQQEAEQDLLIDRKKKAIDYLKNAIHKMQFFQKQSLEWKKKVDEFDMDKFIEDNCFTSELLSNILKSRY